MMEQCKCHPRAVLNCIIWHNAAIRSSRLLASQMQVYLLALVKLCVWLRGSNAKQEGQKRRKSETP